MNNSDQGSNIQNLRNKIKISLETCEKVLDDFSNLTFLQKTLENCERDCHDKFHKIYNENEKNEFYNFRSLKNEFYECTNKCEDIYKQVMHHQIKGAEISYVSQIILFYKSLLIKNI